MNVTTALLERRHPHRTGEGAAAGTHAALRRVLRAGAPGHARRGPLLLPAQRALADLHRARGRRPGLGRGRQRVPRLPQRLRGHVRRAREPGDRRRGQGADGPRHALRGAHRGLDRRRGGAAPPLGPAALALHELRHGVDDGRRAPRARAHGQRRDHQDRGLLPRPPRRRDGLRQAAGRPDGRPRPPERDPLRPRLRRRHRGGHAARAVQRRRRGRARPRQSSRAGSPG